MYRTPKRTMFIMKYRPRFFIVPGVIQERVEHVARFVGHVDAVLDDELLHFLPRPLDHHDATGLGIGGGEIDPERAAVDARVLHCR